jgi:outer membrane protein OmpA-like peptidoglycan-associated protein
MDRVSHELANFRISDERARAVAEELVRLGVDPTAIIVEAVSDQQPAFVEAMPAGEAGNRRAEILLEN